MHAKDERGSTTSSIHFSLASSGESGGRRSQPRLETPLLARPALVRTLSSSLPPPPPLLIFPSETRSATPPGTATVPPSSQDASAAFMMAVTQLDAETPNRRTRAELEEGEVCSEVSSDRAKRRGEAGMRQGCATAMASLPLPQSQRTSIARVTPSTDGSLQFEEVDDTSDVAGRDCSAAGSVPVDVLATAAVALSSPPPPHLTEGAKSTSATSFGKSTNTAAADDDDAGAGDQPQRPAPHPGPAIVVRHPHPTPNTSTPATGMIMSRERKERAARGASSPPPTHREDEERAPPVSSSVSTSAPHTARGDAAEGPRGRQKPLTASLVCGAATAVPTEYPSSYNLRLLPASVPNEDDPVCVTVSEMSVPNAASSRGLALTTMSGMSGPVAPQPSLRISLSPVSLVRRVRSLDHSIEESIGALTLQTPREIQKDAAANIASHRVLGEDAPVAGQGSAAAVTSASPPCTRESTAPSLRQQQQRQPPDLPAAAIPSLIYPAPVQRKAGGHTTSRSGTNGQRSVRQQQQQQQPSSSAAAAAPIPSAPASQLSSHQEKAEEKRRRRSGASSHAAPSPLFTILCGRSAHAVAAKAGEADRGGGGRTDTSTRSSDSRRSTRSSLFSGLSRLASILGGGRRRSSHNGHSAAADTTDVQHSNVEERRPPPDDEVELPSEGMTVVPMNETQGLRLAARTHVGLAAVDVHVDSSEPPPSLQRQEPHHPAPAPTTVVASSSLHPSRRSTPSPQERSIDFQMLDDKEEEPPNELLAVKGTGAATIGGTDPATKAVLSRPDGIGTPEAQKKTGRRRRHRQVASKDANIVEPTLLHPQHQQRDGLHLQVNHASSADGDGGGSGVLSLATSSRALSPDASARQQPRHDRRRPPGDLNPDDEVMSREDEQGECAHPASSPSPLPPHSASLHSTGILAAAEEEEPLPAPSQQPRENSHPPSAAPVTSAATPEALTARRLELCAQSRVRSSVDHFAASLLAQQRGRHRRVQEAQQRRSEREVLREPQQSTAACRRSSEKAAVVIAVAVAAKRASQAQRAVSIPTPHPTKSKRGSNSYSAPSRASKSPTPLQHHRRPVQAPLPRLRRLDRYEEELTREIRILDEVVEHRRRRALWAEANAEAAAVAATPAATVDVEDRWTTPMRRRSASRSSLTLFAGPLPCRGGSVFKRTDVPTHDGHSTRASAASSMSLPRTPRGATAPPAVNYGGRRSTPFLRRGPEEASNGCFAASGMPPCARAVAGDCTAVASQGQPSTSSPSAASYTHALDRLQHHFEQLLEEFEEEEDERPSLEITAARGNPESDSRRLSSPSSCRPIHGSSRSQAAAHPDFVQHPTRRPWAESHETPHPVPPASPSTPPSSARMMLGSCSKALPPPPLMGCLPPPEEAHGARGTPAERQGLRRRSDATANAQLPPAPPLSLQPTVPAVFSAPLQRRIREDLYAPPPRVVAAEVRLAPHPFEDAPPTRPREAASDTALPRRPPPSLPPVAHSISARAALLVEEHHARQLHEQLALDAVHRLLRCFILQALPLLRAMKEECGRRSLMEGSPVLVAAPSSRSPSPSLPSSTPLPPTVQDEYSSCQGTPADPAPPPQAATEEDVHGNLGEADDTRKAYTGIQKGSSVGSLEERHADGATNPNGQSLDVLNRGSHRSSHSQDGDGRCPGEGSAQAACLLSVEHNEGHLGRSDLAHACGEASDHETAVDGDAGRSRSPSAFAVEGVGVGPTLAEGRGRPRTPLPGCSESDIRSDDIRSAKGEPRSTRRSSSSTSAAATASASSVTAFAAEDEGNAVQTAEAHQSSTVHELRSDAPKGEGDDGGNRSSQPGTVTSPPASSRSFDAEVDDVDLSEHGEATAAPAGATGVAGAARAPMANAKKKGTAREGSSPVRGDAGKADVSESAEPCGQRTRLAPSYPSDEEGPVLEEGTPVSVAAPWKDGDPRNGDGGDAIEVVRHDGTIADDEPSWLEDARPLSIDREESHTDSDHDGDAEAGRHRRRRLTDVLQAPVAEEGSTPAAKLMVAEEADEPPSAMRCEETAPHRYRSPTPPSSSTSESSLMVHIIGEEDEGNIVMGSTTVVLAELDDEQASEGNESGSKERESNVDTTPPLVRKDGDAGCALEMTRSDGCCSLPDQPTTCAQDVPEKRHGEAEATTGEFLEMLPTVETPAGAFPGYEASFATDGEASAEDTATPLQPPTPPLEPSPPALRRVHFSLPSEKEVIQRDVSRPVEMEEEDESGNPAAESPPTLATPPEGAALAAHTPPPSTPPFSISSSPSSIADEAVTRDHVANELLEKLHGLDALLLSQFPAYFTAGMDENGLPAALWRRHGGLRAAIVPPPPRAPTPARGFGSAEAEAEETPTATRMPMNTPRILRAPQEEGVPPFSIESTGEDGGPSPAHHDPVSLRGASDGLATRIRRKYGLPQPSSRQGFPTPIITVEGSARRPTAARSLFSDTSATLPTTATAATRTPSSDLGYELTGERRGKHTKYGSRGGTTTPPTSIPPPTPAPFMTSYPSMSGGDAIVRFTVPLTATEAYTSTPTAECVDPSALRNGHARKPSPHRQLSAWF